MISRDEHQRQMEIIQQEIEAAHKKLKEQADNTLKSISENYQNQLLKKMAEELRLVKEALRRGDEREADQHRIRAEVYKSALDAIKG